MSRYLDRLRNGQRCWAAEIALRAGGLVLLGTCYRMAMLAHRLINTAPPHPATPGEFGVCAVVFLLLTSGLALSFVGAGLFRHVPIPAHSAYFPRV